LKMCPHFDLLDEIYGTKASIIPPFIYDTSSSQVPPVDEESQMQGTIDDSTQPRISTVEQREKSAYQKPKGGSVPGLTALAESNKIRCEFQFAEFELNREKIEDEKRRRDQQNELEKAKFEFDKEICK
jgi:hypothetical protein